MAVPTSSMAPRVVRVWHAHVDDVFDGPGRLARAVARLRPAEQARYARFRHDVDRRMFLLGRVMARAAVGDALGLDPHDWPWREGERGRPEVDLPDCSITFNLAHSGGVVVCALADCGLVGVDVEARERVKLERALVARCCGPEEAAGVGPHGDRWRDRFLQYWTLKESYLKAVGLGISVPLDEVCFRIDGEPRSCFRGSLAGADAGWAFDLTTLGSTHYLAVAVSPVGGTRPQFVRLPFPTEWMP